MELGYGKDPFNLALSSSMTSGNSELSTSVDSSNEFSVGVVIGVVSAEVTANMNRAADALKGWSEALDNTASNWLKEVTNKK